MISQSKMKFDEWSLIIVSPWRETFALKEKNTQSRKTAIFRNVKATNFPLFKSSWSSLSYFKCSWNKLLRLETFGESSIFCLPLRSVWRGMVWREACRVPAVAFLQPPAHALEWLGGSGLLYRRQANARPATIDLETCWGSWRRCVLRLEHLQGISYSLGCLWLDDFVVTSCLLVHELRCSITSGTEKLV